MFRSIFKLGIFSLLSFSAFRFARSALSWGETLDYSVKEDDIIADLPGAKMHLNTPAA